MSRPLSRIPPFQNWISLRLNNQQNSAYIEGRYTSVLSQDRLSYGDTLDRRIPFGGTPEYHRFDINLGIYVSSWIATIVLENLTDQPYRVHGSSINGAGRSASITLRYEK